MKLSPVDGSLPTVPPMPAADPIEVRPATPEDYPAIADLTVAAYEADGQLEAGDPYAQVLADVARRADAGELLVAVDGAEVLGSVLLVEAGSSFAETAGPGEAEFRMLAVSPKAQRRGAGERLVRACLERARDRGAERVVISARDFVEAPLRLYDRLGFVRVPERDWTPVPGVRLVGLRYDLSVRRDDLI
jgi:ribosomal protein S18 acetylase RimI-like enzyme